MAVYVNYPFVLFFLLLLYFYPFVPPKHGDGEEKRDRERNRDRMREKKSEFTITTVPCEEIVKLGLWLNRAMDKNYFLFCSFFEKSANLNFCKNFAFYMLYILFQNKK